MNAKRILFPTDFSKLSDAALEQATALARESGAELLIVHAEEPPFAYGGGEMYYGMPEPDRKTLLAMLKAVVPAAADVRYQHRMISGEPAEAILETAKKEHVDLIVMATHGRTGLLHLLMGSVAEAVARRAECPVMVVKGGVLSKPEELQTRGHRPAALAAR